MAAIQFAIRQPGSDWRPPTGPQGAKLIPIDTPWEEILARAGFRPATSSNSALTRVRSAVIGYHETYYGSFGTGVQVSYIFERPEQKVQFMQLQVLRSANPFTFIYPPSLVKAYPTTIRGAPGVAALPLKPEARLWPFVYWSPDGYLLNLTFFWSLSEETMLAIANSFS